MNGTEDNATAPVGPALSGLGLIVFSGGFDRVHYAYVMASAAAAVNKPVQMFFTGRALFALTRPLDDGRPGWTRLDPADDGTPAARRDAGFGAAGVAQLDELMEACAALDVPHMACEMGLRTVDLEGGDLRDDLGMEITGLVTFYSRITPHTHVVFI